jgi:Kdo2-lipid IVA lauroyltransferase/acyltransferase
MSLTGWMQNAIVGVGARGIAMMRPAFRERVAQQMADNWVRQDETFVRTVDTNLRRMWPAMAAAQRQALLRANALRTARGQLDHFWAWHARPARLRDTVRLQGLEQIVPGRPVVIAGAHRLGFEVALMRLSMEVSGALIFDPGATPLPRAAQRAWSRFRPQQVIAAHGGARPALRAVRAGLPLLVLAEEPADPDGAIAAPVLGGAMRFTPLVAWLARATGAQVLWLDVEQQDGGHHAVGLSPIHPQREMADGPASARRMAALVERALRSDPAGYWWARAALPALQPPTPRQSAAKAESSGSAESSVAG